jgi:hypothetical protein
MPNEILFRPMADDSLSAQSCLSSGLGPQASTQKSRNSQAPLQAIDFRKIDQNIVCEVIEFLNGIEGRPFFGEDCTSLVERAPDSPGLHESEPLCRRRQSCW